MSPRDFKSEPILPKFSLDRRISVLMLALTIGVIGTIAAEELGVTSANVSAMADDAPSVAVARLLGVGFEDGAVTDTGLDVDVDFMQDVLAQVGNYGEIYEANITPIGIERAGTLNALWSDDNGGLIYSPPFK